MRPLWGAVVTWTLVAFCPGGESRSPAGHLWKRLRQMAFPGKPRGEHRPATSMFVLEPDFGAPFLYAQNGFSRTTPWPKLYVYNRPMGFRHWRQENRPSMRGRKLTKVKVVKKFVRHPPIQSSPMVILLSPHGMQPQKEVQRRPAQAWNLGSLSPPRQVLRPDVQAPTTPKPKLEPPRPLVYLTGAYSSDPGANLAAGSSVNDVTLIHNSRKYTVSATSKARLKGLPGLVVHVGGLGARKGLV
ncbi:uncharacterized protein LOC144170134 [Haemaphysalis longicornis]